MSFRVMARELLSRFETADALFRRFVWSRIHYPEFEILKLSALRGRPFDVAVDIGAALGSYTWVLSRKAREVIAFEPGQRHFSALKRGAVASNVVPVNTAAGRESGIATLYSFGDGRDADHTATLSHQNPLVNSGEARAQKVPVISLDEYFSARRFTGRSVDLIKIDVEGFELDVLLGARSVLARFSPLVICEIEVRHNANFGEVFALMRSFGYCSGAFFEGNYLSVSEEDVPRLQSEEALSERLSGRIESRDNRYVNNFVFSSPRTKVSL